MVYSMTGYANLEVALEQGIAKWEIRSVNHRYLELSFKLPLFFSDLEYSLREIIKKKLSRGKVDCILKIDFLEEANSEISLNLEMADKLMEAYQVVSERFKLQEKPNAFEILNWPLVVQTKAKDFVALKDPLQQSFDKLLNKLIETRAREGNKLGEFIKERIIKMNALLDEVSKSLPEIERAYKEKFEKRMLELELEMGADRFLPSIMSLIQKMDISEELDRLKMHLIEVNRVLNQEIIVGRRLDFLMQELNREANTLSAKAIEGLIVQKAVQLKVMIEEMREQIQNLE